MFQAKRLLLVACGAMAVVGCVEENQNTEESALCASAAASVTASDGRVLCIDVASEAQAPFSEGFYAARVLHKITVVDSNGNPVDTTTDQVVTRVSHHPMMHMDAGHSHSTPHGHDADVSRADQGIYTLPAYYIMASMGGTWDYQVRLTDAGAAEPLTATFVPNVMAVPGDDVLVSGGSNSSDQWQNMMGMVQPRPYKIWLDEVVDRGDGSHDFGLFVSTQDMAMTGDGHGMRFPALAVGGTLHDANGDAVSVSSVTVRVSSDGGASWQSLADAGHGRYSGAVTGLNGQANIQIELMVNGLLMQASGSHPELIFTAP